jgi:hypothetical protein
MKVFDGFASPRWSEAEPGVGSKKMGVPGGGQQKPLTRNGVPIVSYFARRGDCFRGALSRMRGLKIENGIGMGHGFGMFVPFGDGFFWGPFAPGFPCAFGAAVTWGWQSRRRLSRYGPSGAAWCPIVSRGCLAFNYLSGTLGV